MKPCKSTHQEAQPRVVNSSHYQLSALCPTPPGLFQDQKPTPQRQDGLVQVQEKRLGEGVKVDHKLTRTCQEAGVKSNRISLEMGCRHLKEQVGKAECPQRNIKCC